jgi:glycine/D-amino acid oxidase-like deaminating enzyme
MIERCLWADTASQPHRPATPPPLPDSTDVAVIGAGYTGLSAARTLAGQGARVVVLERHGVGWGASGRNGGFVLPGFKADLEPIAQRDGVDRARELFELSLEAIGFLEQLIASEAIACDYVRGGSITLAAKPGHLRVLDRTQRFLRNQFGHATELVGVEWLRQEIGSTRYHGGLLDPRAAALHPLRYCQGLASAAERAGARLVVGTDVRRIRRGSNGFELETSRGRVSAREVVVATDGYSGDAFPPLRDRIVPVGSYLIATAPIDPARGVHLARHDRVLFDTKHLLYYFRFSPDDRVVFGGRASFTPLAMTRYVERLKAGLLEVFPGLSGVSVEYAWGGAVGFTLDQLPHAGRIDGIHYAAGYGGHGVALATYLGARVGEALAGGRPLPRVGGPTFRSIPLYRGRPWFLPLVGAYYGVRDGVS